MANRDPHDFTNKFNTALGRDEEKRFRDWLARGSETFGRNLAMDLGDYDLRGQWKESKGQPLKPGVHGTDRFKKPNHPTFSDESIYHGSEGYVGGHWGEGTFRPSPSMLKSRPKGFLQDYFNKYEKGVRLELPEPEQPQRSQPMPGPFGTPRPPMPQPEQPAPAPQSTFRRALSNIATHFDPMQAGRPLKFDRELAGQQVQNLRDRWDRFSFSPPDLRGQRQEAQPEPAEGELPYPGMMAYNDELAEQMAEMMPGAAASVTPIQQQQAEKPFDVGLQGSSAYARHLDALEQGAGAAPAASFREAPTDFMAVGRPAPQGPDAEYARHLDALEQQGGQAPFAQSLNTTAAPVGSMQDAYRASIMARLGR